jgi:methionyl aminopeptidase
MLTLEGAKPAPELLYGFPGAVCISVNEEALHGIPGSRTVAPGDVVKLDLTIEKEGYIADAAVTVNVDPVPELGRKLAQCARRAFDRALQVARAGRRVYEIGRVVEKEVRASGFSVLREFGGHGVGRHIHEDPSVPNFFDSSARQRLTEGLVITIEPVIAAGDGKINRSADGWTIRTGDGSLAAHFEHTIVITNATPILITAV